MSITVYSPIICVGRVDKSIRLPLTWHTHEWTSRTTIDSVVSSIRFTLQIVDARCSDVDTKIKNNTETNKKKITKRSAGYTKWRLAIFFLNVISFFFSSFDKHTDTHARALRTLHYDSGRQGNVAARTNTHTHTKRSHGHLHARFRCFVYTCMLSPPTAMYFCLTLFFSLPFYRDDDDAKRRNM